LIFFRLKSGHEPVREWLKELPEPERQAIGEDLLRAQWRWPVGMPLYRRSKEEGIFEAAQAQAVKEVVAWQLAEAMKTKKISKNKMAILLKTSRTQVDRLLDPKNDITLSSLQRAALIVGRRVSIELV
jgi:hypothetical protein